MFKLCLFMRLKVVNRKSELTGPWFSISSLSLLLHMSHHWQLEKFVWATANAIVLFIEGSKILSSRSTVYNQAFLIKKSIFYDAWHINSSKKTQRQIQRHFPQWIMNCILGKATSKPNVMLSETEVTEKQEITEVFSDCNTECFQRVLKNLEKSPCKTLKKQNNLF